MERWTKAAHLNGKWKNRNRGCDPLADCLSDSSLVIAPGVVGCWQLVVGRARPFPNTEKLVDGNDPRMQQVVLANGKLWAGLDTGLIIEGTLPQEQASPISSSIPTLARCNSRVALESWAT